MGTQAEVRRDEPVEPRRPWWRPRLWVVGVFVMAVLAVAAAYGWWTKGGAFLHATGPGCGVPVAIGEPATAVIDLTTTGGGSVELERVTAHGAGAAVTYAVVRNGGAAGCFAGDTTPVWRFAAIHGARVLEPEHHPAHSTTWIVVTIVANRAGVYHVDDVVITYRSGPRTRRVRASFDACVLAYPPERQHQILDELDRLGRGAPPGGLAPDPLVSAYERCSGPQGGG